MTTSPRTRSSRTLLTAPALTAVMADLQALARPDALAGMAAFGMNVQGRLGISVPALRTLGKQVGRHHALALQLHEQPCAEAQILAAYVAEPAQFTTDQMDAWAGRFQSWDTCDQACTNAFAPSPRAWGRVSAWAPREDEWVRRAAFSLLAALAVHDKRAEDARFIEHLPLIAAHADDERNFVRKAVNWALRQIGKRNDTLLLHAIDCAQSLAQRSSRAARWIAADALRELRPRVQPQA